MPTRQRSSVSRGIVRATIGATCAHGTGGVSERNCRLYSRLVSVFARVNSNRPSLLVIVPKRLSGEKTSARPMGSWVTLLITTPRIVSAGFSSDLGALSNGERCACG